MRRAGDVEMWQKKFSKKKEKIGGKNFKKKIEQKLKKNQKTKPSIKKNRAKKWAE